MKSPLVRVRYGDEVAVDLRCWVRRYVNLLLEAQPSSWGELAKKEGLGEDGAGIWSGDGNISLSAMQEYAKSLNESVNSLSEADFDREVDTRFAGTQSVGWVLALTAVHTATHTGEISAVKGMQGMKGLPF